MIRVLEQRQGGTRSQFSADGLELFQGGKLVPRALYEQHRHMNIKQVFAPLA
jgi:hypothetical protein